MRLSDLFPRERIVIRSGLNPADIIRVLEENVEQKQKFRWNPFSRDHKYFRGEIKGDRFKLFRIISYRTTFLPSIEGEIKGGSIEFTIELPKPTRYFMYFWFGFLFIFLAIVLSTISFPRLFYESPDIEFLLGPVTMIVLGYAMMIGVFKFESMKAKDYLRKIFQGTFETP